MVHDIYILCDLRSVQYISGGGFRVWYHRHFLEKNLNERFSRPSEHPPAGVKNVKTFSRWDRQRQNLSMLYLSSFTKTNARCKRVVVEKLRGNLISQKLILCQSELSVLWKNNRGIFYMTVPRVLFRNSGVFGKFSILGMSLLRGARGRLVPTRSLISFFLFPFSLLLFRCPFPSLIYLLGVLESRGMWERAAFWSAWG